MNRIAMNGAWAGVLGAALFASAADAEVVVHDNTAGTFDWVRSFATLDGFVSYGNFLDITQPPTQSGFPKLGTFLCMHVSAAVSSNTFQPTSFIDGYGTPEIALADDPIPVEWNGDTLFLFPTREYRAGEFVGGGADWKGDSSYFFHEANSSEFTKGTPGISKLAYIGVRLKEGSDYRYGWILFKDYAKPVMWAYETELNTPIQVPVPAPAGALVGTIFGVSLTVRRRHRT